MTRNAVYLCRETLGRVDILRCRQAKCQHDLVQHPAKILSVFTR
jgi:hypothetical protein